MTDTPTTYHAGDQQREARFIRMMQRLGWFWSFVLYALITSNVYDIWQTRPDLLRGWTSVPLYGALAVFMGLYHGILCSPGSYWPMPPRRAVLYFGGQFAVLLLLMRYNVNFGWLAWALMAHAASTLPMKQWPLPMLGSLLVVAVPFGIYGDVAGGRWGQLVGFAFLAGGFLAIYIVIYMLFSQRYELAATVQQLRHAKHQLEEQAAQAEELAALRERTRLARDMHDSIGHALVVVNVKLEAAQRLYAVDAARGSAELDATKTLVRDTMADLRRSLADLRAPLLDHHDLTTTLHQLAEEMRSRSDLHLTCSTPTDTPPLAPEATEALWRVAREALSNTERHAHAAHATLCLERQNGSLVLRVTDDGRGINVNDHARWGHYGIVGMRERVEAIGGIFHIARRAEGGTMVEARVPVNNDTGIWGHGDTRTKHNC
jgi:signal transduction histidine kinase